MRYVMATERKGVGRSRVGSRELAKSGSEADGPDRDEVKGTGWERNGPGAVLKGGPRHSLKVIEVILSTGARLVV